MAAVGGEDDVGESSPKRGSEPAGGVRLIVNIVETNEVTQLLLLEGYKSTGRGGCAENSLLKREWSGQGSDFGLVRLADLEHLLIVEGDEEVAVVGEEVS